MVVGLVGDAVGEVLGGDAVGVGRVPYGGVEVHYVVGFLVSVVRHEVLVELAALRFSRIVCVESEWRHGGEDDVDRGVVGTVVTFEAVRAVGADECGEACSDVGVVGAAEEAVGSGGDEDGAGVGCAQCGAVEVGAGVGKQARRRLSGTFAQGYWRPRSGRDAKPGTY